MSAADRSWHALAAADVLAALETGVEGLTSGEAARRLAQSGPNRLTPPPPVSALHILAAQFRGVVMLLLASAAAVSLRSWATASMPLAIGAVLAINALLGFTIELRARRAMEGAAAARRHARLRAPRRPAPWSIDADLLVPGDVLELDAGQTVPADARVISGNRLSAPTRRR